MGPPSLDQELGPAPGIPTVTVEPTSMEKVQMAFDFMETHSRADPDMLKYFVEIINLKHQFPNAPFTKDLEAFKKVVFLSKPLQMPVIAASDAFRALQLQPSYNHDALCVEVAGRTVFACDPVSKCAAEFVAQELVAELWVERYGTKMSPARPLECRQSQDGWTVHKLDLLDELKGLHTQQFIDLRTTQTSDSRTIYSRVSPAVFRSTFKHGNFFLQNDWLDYYKTVPLLEGQVLLKFKDFFYCGLLKPSKFDVEQFRALLTEHELSIQLGPPPLNVLPTCSAQRVGEHDIVTPGDPQTSEDIELTEELAKFLRQKAKDYRSNPALRALEAHCNARLTTQQKTNTYTLLRTACITGNIRPEDLWTVAATIPLKGMSHSERYKAVCYITVTRVNIHKGYNAVTNRFVMSYDD
jgi:hypothetical protein